MQRRTIDKNKNITIHQKVTKITTNQYKNLQNDAWKNIWRSIDLKLTTYYPLFQYFSNSCKLSNQSEKILSLFTYPLLICTGFLKYPFGHSFQTEIKINFKTNWFFFQFLLKFFFSSNGYFKKPVEINRRCVLSVDKMLIWN